MSRSFHGNRKLIAREARFLYRDAAARRDRLRALWSDVSLKRRVKDMEAARRRGACEEIPWVDPASIPIHVFDESSVVHYPSSPDDIREVMRRLPAGMLSGVQEIHLSLRGEGAESNLGFDETCKPDPYTGRISRESAPGVWTPPVLGTYQAEHDRIFLNAYVYPESLQDREMWEFYLRLQMLSTFVHEVGHFRDYWSNRSRPRWNRMSHDRREWVAQRAEALFLDQFVVPYLLARYPESVSLFQGWLSDNAGGEIPLCIMPADATVGPDKRVHWRGCRVGGAIERLAVAHREGGAVHEHRAWLATVVHWSGHDASALPLLRRVVFEDPTNLDAQSTLAEALVNSRMEAEAIDVLRAILRVDSGRGEDWRKLLRSLRALARFGEMLETVSAAQTAGQWPESDGAGFVELRAHALVSLGRFSEAEEDLARLREFAGPEPAPGELDDSRVDRSGARRPFKSGATRRFMRWNSAADGLQAVIWFRQGLWEDVLRLNDPERLRSRYSSYMLVAAAADAAHATGRPELAPRVNREVIDQVRSCGWHDWASELASRHGSKK